MRRRGGLGALAPLAAVLLGVAVVAVSAWAPARAQERMMVPSPVLTVDQEALFRESAFGKRAQREIEEASAELAAENRRIESELEAEERRLTDARAGMDPAEFRELAADFDARVVELRRTQDQKSRDLARRPEEARQAFFRAAVPILTAIVRDRGAVAILDARAVILSAEAIDITQEAIARIDETLGDGSAQDTPAPPQDAPAETPPDAPEAAPQGQP